MEFITVDSHFRGIWFAPNDPTLDHEFHETGVSQQNGPVHHKLHLLADIQQLLYGEAHFAAAHLDRLSETHDGESGCFYALVPNFLLNGKAAPGSLRSILGKFDLRHWTHLCEGASECDIGAAWTSG